jgi:predicted DNA-binding transcriptional regulator YafY
MHEHDKIAQRLGMLLTRLYSGEKLHLHELAAEYNVTLRTLQRDLNERLSYLPIESRNRQYWLRSDYLHHKNDGDLRRLAEQLGIADLFPYASEQRLRQLLDKSHPSLFAIKGFNAASAEPLSRHMPVLEQALTGHLQCWLITKDQRKQLFSPYQLINYKGTWHLVGVSEGRLQAYPLSTIELVELSQQAFAPDPVIQRQIDTDPTLWRSGMIEVLLKAHASIAINFQHRPLLPEQEIVKTLDDGSLLLTSRVFDANQILPVIKSWMPGLTVISPGFIHEQIVRDLRQLLSLMSQAPP